MEDPSPEPKPIDVNAWLKRDYDVYIDKFIVTAVKMPRKFKPDDTSKQLIHWRGGGAYCQIVGGKEEWKSISFDTRKLDPKDPVVEVQLISKPFMVSSLAPYYWESPLLRKFTPKDVYDLLVAKGFNRYKYNGEGSGCLTWTTALVSALEKEGVLPVGSERSLLRKVEDVRADTRFWVPEEPEATFWFYYVNRIIPLAPV